VFLITTLASIGLPTLSNFVGEFLVLTGSFKVSQLATVMAFIGIILPLVYTVRLVQEVIFQVSAYGGMPVTLAALDVMRKIYADADRSA
jgi:NADH:ubiquinone oxidoreductase subunit 4 (subunit M)